MTLLFFRFLVILFFIIFTAVVVPGITVVYPVNLFLSAFIVTILNFTLLPIVYMLARMVRPVSLGLWSFLLNLLVLNMAFGLIDHYGSASLSAGVFGATLIGAFSTLLDLSEETRTKLIS